MWLIRDADGAIINAGVGRSPLVAPPPGGSAEVWAMSLDEFWARFRLFAPRRVAAADGATVTVTVTCPERAGRNVWVAVNDAEVEVTIGEDGTGTLELDASAPTRYIVQPAENAFAPLGEGTVIVEVV